MTDLDNLRTLAQAATPGPWEADHREVSQSWSRPEPWQTVASHEVDCMAYCYGGAGRGIERPEDAEFIAAANPDTVLDLLDRLKAVEELHQPIEVQALSGDCASEECDCEECPTSPVVICSACHDLADEVNPHYGGRSLHLVTHPCPTIKALRGES